MSNQRDGHINRRTQDKIRASIKTQEILNQLQNHCLGLVKMTNTQVRAGEIILRKILADLTATTVTDDTSTALPLLQIVRSNATQERSGPPSSKVQPGPEPAPDPPADAA